MGKWQTARIVLLAGNGGATRLKWWVRCEIGEDDVSHKLTDFLWGTDCLTNGAESISSMGIVANELFHQRNI